MTVDVTVDVTQDELKTESRVGGNSLVGMAPRRWSATLMASLVIISALVPAAAFMAPSLPGTLHGRARAAFRRPLPRQRKVESARGPALWTAVDSATLGELPVVIGALLGGDALHHVLPHFPLADAFDSHRDGILLAVDAASQARALHSSDPTPVSWHAVMACVHALRGLPPCR